MMGAVGMSTKRSLFAHPPSLASIRYVSLRAVTLSPAYLYVNDLLNFQSLKRIALVS